MIRVVTADGSAPPGADEMELSGQPYRNGRNFLAELRNDREEQKVINVCTYYIILCFISPFII